MRITHSLRLRAARFMMRTPVRYRLVGDSEWHEGQTENISRSGVLFRVERASEPSAPIEMRLVLPVTLFAPSTAGIVLTGFVTGRNGLRAFFTASIRPLKVVVNTSDP